MRAVLVGCVAGKLDHPAPARDLYTTPLFRKRRDYAERMGLPWFVLSARHGLVTPDTRLYPYNEVLAKARISDFTFVVYRQMLKHFADGDVLEVHAGVHYVDGVTRSVRRLERFGGLSLQVETPLRGLSIGKQLQWYGKPQLEIKEAA